MLLSAANKTVSYSFCQNFLLLELATLEISVVFGGPKTAFH